MNICLSAGGTGGHIFPAIALGDELYKQGHKIFYIGNQDKMEAQIVKDKPYTFLPIKNEGLKPGLMAKIKGLTSQFKAIRQCKHYLKENKIDVVVSFGGYVTFPVGVAAGSLKIPYLIHEQNSIAGKANKAITKKSKGVIVCFEEVIKQFNHPDVRFLGNPRASIVASSEVDENFLSELGLHQNSPIVYFVMGSLGSSSMSDVVIEYLNKNTIKNYQFVISAGRQYDDYLKRLNPQENVKVFESVNQIQLLKVASLVISRAGATSIAEICASQVPVIYIPSPFVVANHQYYNALELANNDAAILIEEKDITGESLFDTIQQLIDDPQKRQHMSEQVKDYSKTDALEKIIDWIVEVGRG